MSAAPAFFVWGSIKLIVHLMHQGHNKKEKNSDFYLEHFDQDQTQILILCFLPVISLCLKSGL